MDITQLSIEQWLMLDLLMRARKRGLSSISKAELINSPKLPVGAVAKLIWAALTLPDSVCIVTSTEIAIADEGVALYNLRFPNGGQPSEIADAIIALPDNSKEHLQ